MHCSKLTILSLYSSKLSIVKIVNCLFDNTGAVNIEGGSVKIDEVQFYGNRQDPEYHDGNEDRLNDIYTTGELILGKCYSQDHPLIDVGDGGYVNSEKYESTKFSSFQLTHFETRNLCKAKFPYEYSEATSIITPYLTPNIQMILDKKSINLFFISRFIFL